MSAAPQPPWTLRRMTAQDVPVVHALEQDLFPADAWPLEMFSAELAQPVCWYWVAEQDDRIVGYAGLMCIRPVGDVQTIAVLPEHEGRGIGSALLRTLHGQARELGATEVLLEVRADNPRAQRLYRRFGYEHIHTRPRYYRDGTDALIMRLDLTAPEPPSTPAPTHPTEDDR
ncbi:ribosomal-protein-alanine acetyltransferase [Kocuria turfanensis]|uniref:Ribosomal-protein-alanine acetyltransferase n=2 Tax=Kocuria turfanensis TaxID=388357 RepID=A0A512IHT6_9MICC|nr:ribosomal-protein-alanine acetyltransferase [Kocuria turfanensis]